MRAKEFYKEVIDNEETAVAYLHNISLLHEMWRYNARKMEKNKR